MPARPLTDAQLQQMYEAVQSTGGNITRAAELIGLKKGTAEGRWRRAKDWAKAQGKPTAFLPSITPVRAPDTLRESVTVTGDDCEITKTTPTRVKTLADLIRVCDIDTQEWTVDRYVCNKWEMGSTDLDGNPQTTELYQVKAWLKRRVQAIAVRAEIADLLALAKVQVGTARPAAVKRIKPAKASPYMLELSIPDLHVGKLAWGAETGGENYDTKTAERLFETALDTLLHRTSGFTFDRVLLVLGNDILHSDSKSGATTSGTPLDNDSRYQKTFGVVRRMCIRAIDRCLEVAPVQVAMVPGNHDTLGVWHLGDSLECWYHRHQGVTIDNAPTSRKYVQFGKVMLLLTHGDKGKRTDYPLLMATERPTMFGATLHREAHTGHLHQTRVQEHHGVKVRISPALCSADAWHAEHAFVGNARAAEAFVWHAEEGLVSLALYTVPAEDGNAA
jgi:hypothetical protein